MRAAALLPALATACLSFDADAPANSDAALADLELSIGELSPPFDPGVLEYSVTLPIGASSLAVTPFASHPDGAAVSVNAEPVLSGEPSPAMALALGDNPVEVVVTPADGEPLTYRIAVERGLGSSQRNLLKSPELAANDLFGQALAIDGDTLVIGSRDRAGGADSGAVLVFRDDNGRWVEEQILRASNADDGDRFGHSVAIDGDMIAVGAPLEDSSSWLQPDSNDLLDSGAVYVFERSGGQWQQTAFIKQTDPRAGDQLGTSVALEGGLLITGAPRDNSGELIAFPPVERNDDVGAAHLFLLEDGAWLHFYTYRRDAPEANDFFGASVAIDSEAIAVGTPFAGGGDGLVILYSRTTGLEQVLRPTTDAGGDRFGYGLALDGGRLAIGAPGDDAADPAQTDCESGAVYVFELDAGDSWRADGKLYASNRACGQHFGARVAVEDWLVAVGAFGESSDATGIIPSDQAPTDTAATEAGAAYLFGRRGDGWGERLFVKASNPDPGDRFGDSLGIDAGTLVVGAPHEQSLTFPQANDSNDVGAVYVFR